MLAKSRLVVKTDIARATLAELVGTFLLVFFGIAGPLNLQLSGITNAFLANLAGAAGVYLGMTAAMSNSGAHLNPIVTTSFASRGIFPWKKVPFYLGAQFLGGFLAAAVAYINFSEGIASLDGSYSFVDSVNATGGAFATYPKPDVSITTAIFDTMLCSGLLVFGICAITDQFNSRVPVYLYSACVAFLILGIVSTFSYNCGAAINPARDLGPRVFTLLAGYGTAGFKAQGGVFWVVASMIPFLGGFLGAYIYWLFIGLQKPGEQERMEEQTTTTTARRDLMQSEP